MIGYMSRAEFPRGVLTEFFEFDLIRDIWGKGGGLKRRGIKEEGV